MSDHVNGLDRQRETVDLPDTSKGTLMRLRAELRQSLGRRKEFGAVSKQFLDRMIGDSQLAIDEFTMVEYQPDAIDGHAFVMWTRGGDAQPLVVTSDMDLMAQFILLYVHARLDSLKDELRRQLFSATTTKGAN